MKYEDKCRIFKSWSSLGLVRKQTSFISGICDERGDELLYAGVPMSGIIKENLGVGGENSNARIYYICLFLWYYSVLGIIKITV